MFIYKICIVTLMVCLWTMVHILDKSGIEESNKSNTEVSYN